MLRESEVSVGGWRIVNRVCFTHCSCTSRCCCHHEASMPCSVPPTMLHTLVSKACKSVSITEALAHSFSHLPNRRHAATVMMMVNRPTPSTAPKIAKGDHLLLQSWRTNIGFVEHTSLPKKAQIFCCILLIISNQARRPGCSQLSGTAQPP